MYSSLPWLNNNGVGPWGGGGSLRSWSYGSWIYLGHQSLSPLLFLIFSIAAYVKLWTS
jgi:hypothetical protein